MDTIRGALLPHSGHVMLLALSDSVKVRNNFSVMYEQLLHENSIMGTGYSPGPRTGLEKSIGMVASPEKNFVASSVISQRNSVVS